jgi:hypothetical protein
MRRWDCVLDALTTENSGLKLKWRKIAQDRDFVASFAWRPVQSGVRKSVRGFARKRLDKQRLKLRALILNQDAKLWD